MAHSDLQDNIRVQVIVEKFKFPKVSHFSNLFADVEDKINRKLDRAKTLAPIIGEQLASRDKIAQQRGISLLNAVRTHALFNSITIKGGGGKQTVSYTVGTNLRKEYPHYVVYGRGGVTAKNRKYLKFTSKYSREVLFRKSVSPASSKNYMAQAEAIFRPQIKSIVEMEVQRVLGN